MAATAAAVLLKEEENLVLLRKIRDVSDKQTSLP
jgi:hypothetical protein